MKKIILVTAIILMCSFLNFRENIQASNFILYDTSLQANGFIKCSDIGKVINSIKKFFIVERYQIEIEEGSDWVCLSANNRNETILITTWFWKGENPDIFEVYISFDFWGSEEGEGVVSIWKTIKRLQESIRRVL